MFHRQSLLLTIAALCIAACAFGSHAVAADAPEFGQADDKAAQAKRAKTVEQFFRRLGRMAPVGTKKKSLDDFYLIGTAELESDTAHADVCFQVKQGQAAVAEYLVGYIENAPENTFRKWHVFFRYADGQQADTALAEARARYDAMVAYRDQLRGIYNAQTIRRC